MARTKSKKNPRRRAEISGTKPGTDESQSKSSSSILKNLMREVKAKTPFTKTLVNPEGEISISDAISQIIEPYRDTANDHDAFKKLVPADEREKMLADMRKLMPDQESREDFTEIVKELMKRKNKFYPDVDRMIVQFKVTDRGDDFHIAVASTLKK
jgi:hypothetical protein